MTQKTIYTWTDRAERAYVVLRERGGHWNLEWGVRDPTGSDNYVQQGDHRTSVLEEAIRLMLDHVRALSEEPDEAARVEPRLRAALASAEA